MDGSVQLWCCVESLKPTQERNSDTENQWLTVASVALAWTGTLNRIYLHNLIQTAIGQGKLAPNISISWNHLCTVSYGRKCVIVMFLGQNIRPLTCNEKSDEWVEEKWSWRGFLSIMELELTECRRPRARPAVGWMFVSAYLAREGWRYWRGWRRGRTFPGWRTRRPRTRTRTFSIPLTLSSAQKSSLQAVTRLQTRQ